MTTAKQTVESDALSGRVLGIIDAYGMRAPVDPRPESASEASQAQPPKHRAKGSPRARRTRKAPRKE